MSDGSRIAEIAAAMRGAARALPPGARMYDDPRAGAFIRTPWLKAVVRVPPLSRAVLRVMDSRLPGIVSEALARSRFAADELARARAEGIDQLVLLGAGYDASALDLDEAIAVFEVDHPHTQRVKRELVAARFPGADAHVRYVPCDFAVDDLETLLRDAGLDTSRRTFVTWLAVTMYIDADAVQRTLHQLAAVCAPGSRLVVDYMHAAVIDGTTTSEGALRAAAAVRKRGEPYVFGVVPEQAEAWLAPSGWRIERHLGADEAARGYQNGGGVLVPNDFMGFVLAERAPAAG